MNMDFKREMPTARVIKEMYPLTEEMQAKKKENDAEIAAIFKGESDKFLLVIGPCSADREDAVLDYISRLRTVADKVSDKIVICPRIYTNKPRTTGDGYKGMLHQPDPNNAPDMLKGLISIRKLHISALEQTGFSCADEMLYPENHQYLSDCLSYVAVGARSTENQNHRLTASGLDIPVGMKNPTGGDLSVILTLVTFGIYGIYWMVVLNNELKHEANEDSFVSGGVAVLLTIVTCGIYGIYWSYKMGEFVDKINDSKSNSSILYLVLNLFGLSIVVYALIQNELNKKITGKVA